MEPPTISTGILRWSPESRRDSQLQYPFSEIGQSSPPYQDRTSVRFVDEENMSSRLLETTPSEKVRFFHERNDNDNVDEEIDEDYSASVSAILQRRASSRRSKQRRSSSPFSHEELSAPSSPRRRSSAFTTTSEIAISVDDPNFKEEQIFENIRLHKEVIANVKHQPWPIRRKLRLIQQAKSYIKRHEGELQVRLKKSRSTRDIWTRFKIVLVKKWNHTKRELINFMNLLIPWELRIKEIESHFGTVVASYFTFLRWLFWVNLVTSIVLTAFVIVPEILFNKDTQSDRKKVRIPDEKTPSWDMLLNFDGFLIHSPIFYGWYSDCAFAGKYQVPTAYFMIGIGVYIYCFIATLRKMAVNFRLSKLSEKEDECIFTWKLFTGWDYMIGNEETSHNRTSSIVLGFKEALLEEAEKKKEKRSWKIISIRVFVNLNVVWMLIFSARAVIRASNEDQKGNSSDSFFVNWWYQNETTVTMTVISNIFPFIFELFGFIEKYHPRKTLRIQLARIMVLNLLNLYTLTFTQFGQINNMTKELLEIKGNVTRYTPIANEQPIPVSAPHTNVLVDMIYSNNRESITYPLVQESSPGIRRKRAAEYNDNRTPSNNEITNSSLKDKYLKGVFPDPATGKYDKPLPSTRRVPYPISLIRSSRREESNVTILYTSTSPQGTRDSNDTLFETILNTQTEPDSETTSSPVANSTFDSVTTEDDDLLNNDNSTDSNSYAFENDFSTDYENFTTSEDITEDPSNFTTEMNFDNTESTSSSNPTEETETLSTSVMRITSSTPTTLSTPIPSSILPEVSTINNSTTIVITKSTTPTTTTTTEMTTTTIHAVSSTTPSPTLEKNPVNLCPTAIPSSNGTKKSKTFCTKLPIIDNPNRLRLRRLCWETMFGQELVKLTIMDLVSNFFSTFFGDFIRALLVRYMNKIWCWDLEKKFPKYADFKIAENILHLVYNQGLVWMGMFFSPGLPLINVAKLMIMMYLRSWAVLTCNVPHEVVFRASRSNNFYLALLLTMLFLCVLPVCYAIVWLQPSWHCGPFSAQTHIYEIFVTTLENIVPKRLHNIMSYMASPGTVIPLIIVLLLVIYYLASLTSALREANIDLKVQLRRERTEERKKMFQMANRRKRGGSDIDSTFVKWKKILQEVPSIKMSEDIAYPDFLDDHRKDDTDVDNSYLKDDEEEKVRRVLRMKKKKSTPDDKWDTLLKQMVPKTPTKITVKDSSSTTSSLKDDSSAPSETIPEIKISRVQTVENILKSTKNQQKTAQSFSERSKEKDTQIKSKPSTPEKWQQKHKETVEQTTEPTTPELTELADQLTDELPDIDLDDVFLQNVIVDVPELPEIQDSISNRIKRRLRKVISVGSSSDTPTSPEYEQQSVEPNSSQSWDTVKEITKSTDDLSESTRLRQTLLLEENPQLRLLKSDSWHTVPVEKLPARLEKRRRSSLSDLHTNQR